MQNRSGNSKVQHQCATFEEKLTQKSTQTDKEQEAEPPQQNIHRRTDQNNYTKQSWVESDNESKANGGSNQTQNSRQYLTDSDEIIG